MKTSLGIIVLMLMLPLGCKKDKDNPENQDAAERSRIIQDYKDNYLGSAVTDAGWKGDITMCDAGSLPQTTIDKVQQRINYFRRLAGLNDNTIIDPSLTAKYQATALMMKVNGQLNHNPPNTWVCYSDLGAAGAMTSNLSIGSHGVNSLTGQMRDDGSNNTAAGHRRWILHSKKTIFGLGGTDNTMSLGVIGLKDGNTKLPEFIAYPPKGFVPQALVFNRWSFGHPSANLDAAEVTMTGPKGNVPLTVVSRARGYGDNSVVWEPVGIDNTNTSDVSYTVTISNVINSPQESYTYTVTLVKP